MTGLALILALAAAPAAVPTTVEELVVTAAKEISALTVTGKVACLAPERMGNPGERPKVVSTYPARGAVVRPGLLVLRVTFDRPMACAGRFGPGPAGRSPCPTGEQKLLFSYDHRTVRIACAAAPDAHYALAANRELEGDVFMGAAGLPAEALGLDFSTSAGPLVTSVCEALAQDAETDRQLARAHRKLDCAAAPPAAPQAGVGGE